MEQIIGIESLNISDDHRPIDSAVTLPKPVRADGPSGAVGPAAVTPVSARTRADFLLLDELGEGSFSTVYTGSERDTGRRFAVKVCSKKQIIRERKIAQVFREKDILGRLSNIDNWHPSIVRLYCTFQDQDSLYFVLTLAEHQDILSLIRRTKCRRLTVQQCRFVMAELLVALDHIHRLDILHRDVKPENILVRRTGHILLSDFGCATTVTTNRTENESNGSENANTNQKSGDERKHGQPTRAEGEPQCGHQNQLVVRNSRVHRCHNGHEEEVEDDEDENDDGRTQSENAEELNSSSSLEETVTGRQQIGQQRRQMQARRHRQRRCSFAGTAFYVSPEVLNGDPIGPPCDLWAFGVVLFQLLTGRKLFDDGSEYLIFQRILHLRYEFLDSDQFIFDAKNEHINKHSEDRGKSSQHSPKTKALETPDNNNKRSSGINSVGHHLLSETNNSDYGGQQMAGNQENNEQKQSEEEQIFAAKKLIQALLVLEPGKRPPAPAVGWHQFFFDCCRCSTDRMCPSSVSSIQGAEGSQSTEDGKLGGNFFVEYFSGSEVASSSSYSSPSSTQKKVIQQLDAGTGGESSSPEEAGVSGGGCDTEKARNVGFCVDEETEGKTKQNSEQKSEEFGENSLLPWWWSCLHLAGRSPLLPLLSRSIDGTANNGTKY